MYALAVTAIYTPCGTPLLEYIQKKSVAQWNKVLSILNALLYSKYVLQTKRSTSVYYYIHVHLLHVVTSNASSFLRWQYLHSLTQWQQYLLLSN